VHVRSVLPADSALRVPKPAREPIADPGLWWLRWLLLALALLALIALLIWLARRWWRGRRTEPTPDVAYAAALAAFERLDRLNLVAAGEPGRHVALAEEIMRDYLAARLPEATPSRTSSELRAALAVRDEVPHERLAALLDTSELVKFAAWPIGPAPATEAGREARGVVDDVERAIREREAREREEAEARARAEREARRRYEEEQRRRVARDGSKDRAA
jgi:signal transduction histidine kinase